VFTLPLRPLPSQRGGVPRWVLNRATAKQPALRPYCATVYVEKFSQFMKFSPEKSPNLAIPHISQPAYLCGVNQE
jgi:hypothetical protein